MSETKCEQCLKDKFNPENVCPHGTNIPVVFV